MFLNSVGDLFLNSRMDKYNAEEANANVGSRMHKNRTLYQDITQDEFDEINLTSNAHIIGDNDSNIDIDKIKEILEKKYHEEPKKGRILENIEEPEEIIEDVKEETKEYDINAILQKASVNHPVDYERERLKKIRDTQYDILKGLNLEDEDVSEKANQQKKEEDLLNLIHTITEKELTREMNPLDLLSDLKGSEHTVVLEGAKDNNSTEVIAKEKEDLKKDIDKTFYTSSLSFTKSDFDDFNDLKEDVESHKLLLHIIIIVITIAIIIGIVILLNSVLHLGLF